MAASDYDFLETRNDIILQAYQLIGVIGPRGVLSGDYLVQGQRALNSMVLHWQNFNVFLWTVVTKTVAMVVDQQSYALGSDPVYVTIDAAYWEKDNKRDPLEVISWRRWQDLPDRAVKGMPSRVAISPNGATLYVDTLPQTTDNLVLLLVSKLKDFDSASTAGDFPARWGNALKYNLAVELAPSFSIPISDRNDLERKANKKFDEAKIGNKEAEEKTFVKGAFG